jgi:hypothetical protein
MLKKKGFFENRSWLLGILLPVLIFLPRAISAKDFKKEIELLHRVSPGESLAKIARRYLPRTEAHTIGDLVQRIQKRNRLKGTLIRPNQHLLIPLARSNPVVSKTIPKERDFEARGIYVNRFSVGSPKMNRLLKELLALGGNTVILDGKDMWGTVSYPSQVKLAREIGATEKATVADPPKLFHFLHKKGLHIGVRLVLFYDPQLAAKRPHLAVRSIATGEPWKENGKATWVDPSHPVVQRYNLDIARELAEMGVDEIQFDYIRFPTMGNIQDATYSFDKEKISKHEVITAFLAQAQKELAPFKVLLSVDVFGVMAWNKPEDIQTTGQKIEDLAKHCDVMSPMIYPSHFYAPFQGIANPGDEPFRCVSEACERFSLLLDGEEVTLRPWIQAFPYGTSIFSKEYILEELRALRQSKARGWLLWSAGNAYDVSWKALAQWNDGSANQEIVKAGLSQVD